MLLEQCGCLLFSTQYSVPSTQKGHLADTNCQALNAKCEMPTNWENQSCSFTGRRHPKVGSRSGNVLRKTLYLGRYRCVGHAECRSDRNRRDLAIHEHRRCSSPVESTNWTRNACGGSWSDNSGHWRRSGSKRNCGIGLSRPATGDGQSRYSLCGCPTSESRSRRPRSPAGPTVAAERESFTARRDIGSGRSGSGSPGHDPV